MGKRLSTNRYLAVCLTLALFCLSIRHAQALSPISEYGSAPVPGQSSSSTPSPLNRIDTILFENDRLRIVASPDKRLNVREPFILANPTRLVIDIVDAKLGNVGTAFSSGNLGGVPFNALRAGQFTEDIVRVVVETPEPERFRLSVNDNTLSLSASHAKGMLSTLYNAVVARSNDIHQQSVKQSPPRKLYNAVFGRIGNAQISPPPSQPRQEPVRIDPQPETSPANQPHPPLDNLWRLQTESSYDGFPDFARRSRIIDIARAQLGLSKNRDRDYVNRTYSLGQDEAWCADFVSTIMDWAGGSPWGHLSRVQDIYDWGLTNRRVTTQPAPANLVIFSYDNGKTYDHIAFVESINPDNTITTIGGNEGHRLPGSEGGGMVARSVYSLGDQRILGFLDPVSPLVFTGRTRSASNPSPDY